MSQLPYGSEQYISSSNFLSRLVVSTLGELHYGLRVRSFYLSQVLGQKKDGFGQILDVGCARGQTAFWLALEFPKSKITGFDVYEPLIEHCRHIARALKIENTNFCVQDVLILNHKARYDLIICVDVLEHIVEWRKALGNLIRALRPGGTMIVHVPHHSRFLGPSFGLRPLFTNSAEERNAHKKKILGAAHVHDGFSLSDFAILDEYKVSYELKCTFNPSIMYLHTLFEAYRGRRRYWHIMMTPVLLALTKLIMKIGQTPKEGGGLLITIQKPW